MTIVNGTRELLDLPAWDFVGSTVFAGSTGSLCIPSHTSDPDQAVIFMVNAALAYMFFPGKNGDVQIANPTLTNAMAAGACGCWNPNGPTGTASAGSPDTITTTSTISRSLAGRRIRLTGGTGAGQEVVILSNTIGANSVITVAPWAVQPDNTTTYLIRSGRYYLMNGGNVASGQFRVYDNATGAWSSLSTTGLPGSWGTDGTLVSTHSLLDTGGPRSFASDTAASSTATTLTGAKAWTLDVWKNFQVHILTGTGEGQTRRISSNTAGAGAVLTVSPAWTVNPGAGATYAIEACDEFLYLAGNAATTLYRFDLTAGTWSTLSPSVARGNLPSAGSAFFFADDQPQPDWIAESGYNGRRIYASHGSGVATWSYYDIALNTWVNSIAPQPGVNSFTTGSYFAYYGGFLYIVTTTGQTFRYSPSENTLFPWATDPYVQSTAVVGNRAFVALVQDGSVKLPFVYRWYPSSVTRGRAMVI